MPLPYRKREHLRLNNRRVDILDTSLNSNDYFGVSEFPSFFGDGKNSFKVNGIGLLQNSKIEVEIIDSTNNTVYWEIPQRINSDGSKYVSVWVYSNRSDGLNTPIGSATVTLYGTTPTGNKVKWRRIVRIDRKVDSLSSIVFLQNPSISVSSSVESYVNIPQTNGEVTNTVVSTTLIYNKARFFTDSVFYSDGGDFTGEMVGGIITGSLTSTTLHPINGEQPTTFTSVIKEVVSPNIVKSEPISKPIDGGRIHTYEISSDGDISADIQYLSTGSFVTTENKSAIANITLSNLSPHIGKIHSIVTSVKSTSLTSTQFEVICVNKITDSYGDTTIKVPIPTEHLNDTKTLKFQFQNYNGEFSENEYEVSNVVFEGGNVYIAGNQSLITGSFHIGNSIGSGIELSGKSSGYIKSVGYEGFTSASEGKGPGGFIIWSGSGDLQIGTDFYPGVGIEMISEGGSSSFSFTTANDGRLAVITDEFFLGDSGQFLSGSGGNIEIFSTNFHLQDDGTITGSNAFFDGFLTALSLSEKVVTITDANSGSYKDGSFNLLLDGSGEGETVLNVYIDTTGPLLPKIANIKTINDVLKQSVSKIGLEMSPNTSDMLLAASSYKGQVFDFLPLESGNKYNFTKRVDGLGGTEFVLEYSTNYLLPITSSNFGIRLNGDMNINGVRLKSEDNIFKTTSNYITSSISGVIYSKTDEVKYTGGEPGDVDLLSGSTATVYGSRNIPSDFFTNSSDYKSKIISMRVVGKLQFDSGGTSKILETYIKIGNDIIPSTQVSIDDNKTSEKPFEILSDLIFNNGQLTVCSSIRYCDDAGDFIAIPISNLFQSTSSLNLSGDIAYYVSESSTVDFVTGSYSYIEVKN